MNIVCSVLCLEWFSSVFLGQYYAERLLLLQLMLVVLRYIGLPVALIQCNISQMFTPYTKWRANDHKTTAASSTNNNHK